MPKASQGKSMAPHTTVTENRDDYNAAFIRNVHFLLESAYQKLTPGQFYKSEEDDITGALCDVMRELTEVAPTQRWMHCFHVEDQHPVSGNRRADGLERRGKRRPKIDIRLVYKSFLPNPTYCIEAKRLYRSDSISEYISGEGIGAFTCGEYAKSDATAGMLAYIQAQDEKSWLLKLRRHISLAQIAMPLGPKSCFCSSHQREDGSKIAIIHVLFDFR
jgi:hypothetical protein